MNLGSEPPAMSAPEPRPGPAPPRKGSAPGKRGVATLKRESSRRFQALNKFRDIGAQAADLGPTERLAWLILWSHVDARTGLARLSYQGLAEKTGLSARQAKRVVATLLRRGFVTIENPGGPKGWRVNWYKLNPTPLEAK